MDAADPLFRQFAHIFETFKISEPPAASEQGGAPGQGAAADEQAETQHAQDLKKVGRVARWCNVC